MESTGDSDYFSLLVTKNANKLLQFAQENKETSNFIDSLFLIGTNVFSLFSDTKIQPLTTFLMTIETNEDTIKREIVFLTKNLDSLELLAFMKTIPNEVIQKIGSDFFFITSKRISKNQSIETYAKFLFILFKHFGFISSYVKNFFFNDRDADEVEVLLKYIGHYDQEQLPVPISFVVIKSLIISIEKLSQREKISELLPLIQNRKELFLKMDKSELNKSMTKVFINLVQCALTVNDFASFKKIIDFFHSIEFENTESICNRILESLNKNVVDPSIIEYYWNYMRENSLTPDLVSYNTVLDYYCSNQKIDKGLEIYKTLKSTSLKLDNYTFTILIKGMRAAKDLPFAVIEQVVKEYRELDQERDVIIYNSFIDLFVYLGQNEHAKMVYEKLLTDASVKPDHVTFNTLIKGNCRNKELSSALFFLEHMRQLHIKPNRITYNSLMDIAVKIQDMNQALKFLDDMRQDEITPDGYTYSIILNGLKINNSTPEIIRSTIEGITKVIELNEFRLDEVFFNSILDVCSKYELYDLLKQYYEIMKANKVNESPVTYGILIKAYGRASEFESAQRIFEKMMQSNMLINEMTYGSILDACAKSGKMEMAMKIFESLKTSHANMNSIVFTTIIKGFMNSEAYPAAIAFFNTVRPLTELPGMIITYNCMLDLYVKKNDIVSAEALFVEIESNFKADLISYSTIIKGLCNNNRKDSAFVYIQQMIKSTIEIDVSVINLFLDSCSNLTDYKLGIQVYQYIMLKKVIPNEITFGIMIKIYGFAKELNKAFDLLELMAVHDIKPSIIIFTNLIHISFYNRNPKKAEVAFMQFKRLGNVGDRLMYSKLVEGLIKFKETGKLMKYVEMAVIDECTMKPEVIQQLEEIFASDANDMELIEQMKNLRYVEKNTYNNTDRFKNKVGNHNTQKFKQQIHDKARENREQIEFNPEPLKQRREGLDTTQAKPVDKKVLFKERDVREFAKGEHKSEYKSEYSKKESTKKPATLYNFRQNAKKED